MYAAFKALDCRIERRKSSMFEDWFVELISVLSDAFVGIIAIIVAIMAS